MNENNAQPDQATQSPPAPPHEVNPPSTNQVSTHDQKPKKDIPWLKILVFGAVILVTLIAFGLIAYLMLGNQSANEEFEELRAKTPAAQEVDPTADWNVYQGEGFTFKYPTEINITQETNESTNTKQTIIKLNNADQKTSLTVLTTESQGSFSSARLEPDKVATYSGISWTYYPHGEWCDAGECGDTLPVIETNKDSTFYSFVVDDTSAETINNIVATFKFTDSSAASSVDTASLKQYINEDMNVSFKVPETYCVISENDTEVNFNIQEFNGSCTPDIYLTVSKIYNTNPKSYPDCSINDDVDYRQQVECIVENDSRIIDKYTAKSYYLDSGVNSYYSIYQVESPKLEIKMFLAGGGLSDALDTVISSFQFTE